MDDEQLLRLYRAIATNDGDPSPFGRMQAMCRAAADLLPVTGAGVMLMAERAHQGTIHATDATIRKLEDLQNAVAEGPCIDSYRLGRPVFEPDLADSGRRAWPQLAPAALEAGMRALFSFPLQLDDTSVGALNLYRDQPGGLAPQEIGDARLLTAMITREVLAMQADAVPGALPTRIGDLSGDRAAIEQATGMVSAQLTVPVAEAARRLRDHAAKHDRPLVEVAHDVVARVLRLE